MTKNKTNPSSQDFVQRFNSKYVAWRRANRGSERQPVLHIGRETLSEMKAATQKPEDARYDTSSCYGTLSYHRCPMKVVNRDRYFRLV